MFSPFLKGSVLFIQNSPTSPTSLLSCTASIHPFTIPAASINIHQLHTAGKKGERSLAEKKGQKRKKEERSKAKKGRKRKRRKGWELELDKLTKSRARCWRRARQAKQCSALPAQCVLYTDSLKHWDTGGERGSCGSEIPPKEGRERKKPKWKKAHFGWRLSSGTRHQRILCLPSLDMVPQRIITFPSIANVRFMGVPLSETRKERDFM